MADEIYIIHTSTLRDIADSIRTVRGLTTDIPTSELASALRTGTVTATAEPTTFSILRIRRQTLVDIANVIREHTGDTSEIPVRELSTKILSAFAAHAKLETPNIYTAVVDDENGATTLSISGGTATYEENPGGGLTLAIMTDAAPKLAMPNIYLMTDPKLAMPNIYLMTDPKLAAPSIYLMTDAAPKLAMPSIYLMTDAAPKLAMPSIYLMTEAVPKLTTPSIYLTT